MVRERRVCIANDLPPFTAEGFLPPDVHAATWAEFVQRFATTPHRRRLVDGLALVRP